MNGIINRAGEVSIEAELKAGENSGTVEMPTQASSNAAMSFSSDCSTTSDSAG